MQISNPKSPELLQAQLATFAAERVEDPNDAKYILANLGNLALDKSKIISRRTTDVEYRAHEGGKQKEKIPLGSEIQVATTDEYGEFLRTVGGSRYETVKRRAEMLTNYDRFANDIAKLQSEIVDHEIRGRHPDLVGGGSNSQTFGIEREGEKYIVRVPRDTDPRPDIIDTHIAGAVLAKGLPHFEQIIAASYEDGVTVAEMMAGKELDRLSESEIRDISDEHLEELVDTLLIANQKGIEIDPKPSNIFYDKTEGFGFIDFGSASVKGKMTADQDLSIVGWMAFCIQGAGHGPNEESVEKHEDEYRRDIELAKANFDVVERYKNVVIRKLIPMDAEKALPTIEKALENLRPMASDPQWIQKRLEQDALWRLKHKATSQQMTAMRTDDFV
jgi:predicted Ser/Thr protein kinase